MAEQKGFLKIKRKGCGYRPICERIRDYNEVSIKPDERHSKEQASRCMDCGTPFCHWGCPLNNLIPEWNSNLFSGKWEKAKDLLQHTNNFPEFTGRVCPAVCEYACVLGINDDAVTIRENELSIIEHSFKNGLIKPEPPKERTGRKAAVIGSGPAGLACAYELNKMGHKVTVYERDDKPGGLLRYGIPDFKLDKNVIDRRIDIMKKEGIEFKTGINVGVGLSFEKLKKEFDAVCLSCGSRVPRDLKIEGRELKGIYFALDFLIQANKKAPKINAPEEISIDAKNQRVIVIGGGDTGADCVGVSNRQGASNITQIEILPRPSETRTNEYPWPKFPLLLKTSTSHEEGAYREWCILTKKFTGDKGYVKKLLCAKVEWNKDEKGAFIMKEIPGSEFEIAADLILLALGFVHPEHNGIVRELNLELDNKGNIKTNNNFMASQKGVFSCGDMRRGQSLVVWAIAEGRNCAKAVNEYLLANPSKNLKIT